MTRLATSAAWIVALGLPVVSMGACKKESKGTTKVGAEVVETAAPIDLPAPPEFVDPQPNADGTHSVVEMRRKSGKYMQQAIKLKGYVLFKYDCAAVLGDKVAKDQPEQCERPHFYIGDAADTSLERSVWVVEVPRAPREDEKKNLPKEELKDPTKWPPEPKYAKGDLIEIDGTWDDKSPRGFVNSDGLLIYGNMTIITPGADSTSVPGDAANPPKGGAPAPGGKPVAPAPARKAPKH